MTSTLLTVPTMLCSESAEYLYRSSELDLPYTCIMSISFIVLADSSMFIAILNVNFFFKNSSQ